MNSIIEHFHRRLHFSMDKFSSQWITIKFWLAQTKSQLNNSFLWCSSEWWQIPNEGMMWTGTQVWPSIVEINKIDFRGLVLSKTYFKTNCLRIVFYRRRNSLMKAMKYSLTQRPTKSCAQTQSTKRVAQSEHCQKFCLFTPIKARRLIINN